VIVAISGASGLIGSALSRALIAEGHSVRTLVRRAARTPSEIAWDPERGELEPAALRGVGVVVNLSGEPIAQRWSAEIKRRIWASRVDGTALLASTIAAAVASSPDAPHTFISASAVGIYGNRGDEVLDEHSALGHDFLANVCKAWEAATAPASDAGARVVHLRNGIVLAREGGGLPKMMMPFRFGLGGRIGDGRQWVSWISLPDAVRAIVWTIQEHSLQGAVNLTAPAPVTNAELTAALSRELHRPAVLPVPRAALRLALGEMAEATLLASQRVMPTRLTASGFTFSHPTIVAALAAVLSR
jgi:uncharacterized protein (TIGR01777 family)